MPMLDMEYQDLLRRSFPDPQALSPAQNSIMHQMFMAGAVLATRVCLERWLMGTLIAELNQYNDALQRALPDHPTPPDLPHKNGN